MAEKLNSISLFEFFLKMMILQQTYFYKKKEIMKLTRILLLTAIVAALAFTFSACSATVSNNTAANNANKANTAVVNVNQAAVNKTVPVSNASNAAPEKKSPSGSSDSDKADDSAAQKIEGELQQGKTESLILYVGMDTGDYAAYCFPNESEAGRAILAACKNKDRCEVSAEVEAGKCTVPELEADLSDSGRIVKVFSVKKIAARK